MSEPTDTSGDTATQATSTRAGTKPTAPPPVSSEPAASSVAPATDGVTAAEYTRTETVTAVQYVAPDGADQLGNIADVQALGLQVDPQTPWDPAGGQNCILVGYEPAEGALPVRTLVQPGQVVVLRSDANAFEVYDADEFKRLYTPA